MQPLRWILLLVGVLFLAALTWWESRRPRQASDDGRLRGEHREPTLNEAGLAGIEAARAPHEPLPVITLGADAPGVDAVAAAVAGAGAHTGAHAAARGAEVRDADGRAAGTEPTFTEPTVTGADSPESGRSGLDSFEARSNQASGTEAAEVDATPGDGIPTLAALPEADLLAPPPLVVDWPPDARILSVRLVPHNEQRFSGRTLRQALGALGFVHGRFGIFHQPDRGGRAVLSAASLMRPGMLEPDSMDYQRFPGLNVFAVLPGPLSALDALEHLLAIAHDLLERTGGRLQDDRGGPLDAARITRWRTELAGTRVADEPASNDTLSGQPAEPAA
jgi:FtsZ-interacting cell division protein ZipA